MATPALQARQHILGYDVLRVMAIVSVVAIHVLMGYRNTVSPTAFVRVLDDWLHYAVPVFFFISGALIWGRWDSSLARSFPRSLRKRATTILLPYLAWSTVYLAISGATGSWSYTLSRTPVLLLSGKSWYHLYFVPVLLFYYLLTPLFAPLARRHPAALVIATYLLHVLAGPAASAYAARVGGPMLVTFVTAAITHLPDVALGAWFARRQDSVLPWLQRWWLGLLLAGSALSLSRLLPSPNGALGTAVSLVLPLGTLLELMGFTGLAFRLRPQPATSNRISRLSILVFGVYLIHPLFVLGLRSSVAGLGMSDLWSHPWFPVVSILLISSASFMLSAVLAGRRATAWLVGARPRQPTARAVERPIQNEPRPPVKLHVDEEEEPP